MDQVKIGQFLRELRRAQKLTQEQLAEELGVSNRSVSRWETGVNLPDFDILLRLAARYGVGVEELLDGQRKENTMNTEKRDTDAAACKAAQYSQYERGRDTRRVFWVFAAGLAAMAGYLLLDVSGLAGAYEELASFLLGLASGVLVLGCVYTSRRMAALRRAKQRLLEALRRE